MYNICPVYIICMPNICPRCAQDVQTKFQRYAKYMAGIFLEYAWDHPSSIMPWEISSLAILYPLDSIPVSYGITSLNWLKNIFLGMK